MFSYGMMWMKDLFKAEFQVWFVKHSTVFPLVTMKQGSHSALDQEDSDDY